MGFSNFRDFVHTWNDYVEKEFQEQETDNQVEMLMAGQPFVMFFQKGKDIYGATEEGRLTFAKMKGDEEDEEWKKEANFLGINLNKALEGIKVHNMFSVGDLEKIKVLDRDVAKQKLLDKAAKMKNVKADKIPPDTDTPPGTVQLKGDDEE
jgi:hypothetical protein